MKSLHIPNPYPLEDISIRKGFTPTKVVLPVTGLDVVVEVGELVVIGQVIAKGISYVHASICGVVIDIANHPFPHPSELPTLCVIIENNYNTDIWKYPNYLNTSTKVQLEKLRQSGIIGLGGAGFDVSTKLDTFIEHRNTFTQTPILIINATESEPTSQSDHALAIHYTKDILQGTDILLKIANIPKAIIAIEQSTSELYTKLMQCNEFDTIEIKTVPVVYTSGAEKLLIRNLLGVNIGVGEYASSKGILSYNVATIKAVYDYFVKSKPLTHRVVTISGEMLTPYNALLPIGTPINELCDSAGHVRTNGVMMGIDIVDTSAPILKTTNVVLFNKEKEEITPTECIKCGQCVTVCPEQLLPQQLYFFIKGDNIDKAYSYNLNKCLVCRYCDEVCPSNIPLSQYFQFGKAKHKQLEHEAELADQSKKRFDFRTYRLERNKKEREEMMAQKREIAKRKLEQMKQEKLTDVD